MLQIMTMSVFDVKELMICAGLQLPLMGATCLYIVIFRIGFQYSYAIAAAAAACR